MKRWFWCNGRFGWPLVGTVLFLSVGLLAADFAWRVLVMPSETLAAVVVGVCVVVLLIIIGLRFLARQRKRSG
jgi:hypothetical protein